MNHKVVALAYDGLCTFEFGCAVEVFALPRPELPVPWYEFAVCAAERGPLRATGGGARPAVARFRRHHRHSRLAGGRGAPAACANRAAAARVCAGCALRLDLLGGVPAGG